MNNSKQPQGAAIIQEAVTCSACKKRHSILLWFVPEFLTPAKHQMFTSDGPYLVNLEMSSKINNIQDSNSRLPLNAWKVGSC